MHRWTQRVVLAPLFIPDYFVLDISGLLCVSTLYHLTCLLFFCISFVKRNMKTRWKKPPIPVLRCPTTANEAF